MKFVDFYRRFKQLYIYGAGKIGTTLEERLKEADISICGYVVSDDKPTANDINDVPIYSFRDWHNNIFDSQTGLLVAMSSKYYDDIAKNLADIEKDDEPGPVLYIVREHFQELFRHAHPVKPETFFTCTEPVSRLFGYDRGMPIDRYYIEKFLRTNTPPAMKVKNVIEVGEDIYSRMLFGGHNDVKFDVLRYDEGADLTKPETLRKNFYDVFICTQVFNFIYDVKAAIHGAHYLLKDGGVLLATVAGNISPISSSDMKNYGHFWGFTYLGIRRLIEETFVNYDDVEIYPFGNIIAANAFVQGMAVEDIPDRSVLDICDDVYTINIGIKAKKKQME